MDQNFKSVRGLVKGHYSHPDIIRSYVNVGLWPSEKKVVDNFFKPGSSILDIGCGAGRTTIALAQEGYEVTGIDFIPEMIEAAKYQASFHNVTVKFTIMDAMNMDFPPESFENAFFSFNGFEQIPGGKNRDKVLRDVWKILKPSGYFILTARSGLAVGRRTIAWALMFMKFFYHRIINIKVKGWEFGDKIWKGEYHHYLNPFKQKTLFQTVGFELVYFNSAKNIEKEKKSTFLTNFSNDKSLFYVLRKKQ